MLYHNCNKGFDINFLDVQKHTLNRVSSTFSFSFYHLQMFLSLAIQLIQIIHMLSYEYLHLAYMLFFE